MEDEFQNIRPYSDEEVAAAMQRMAKARQLRPLMSFLHPDKPMEQIIPFIKSLQSTNDFQSQVVIPAFRDILNLTSKGLIIAGFENFDGKPCLFVSNHRDITLDAVILNDSILKLKNEYTTTNICVGDNLMPNQFLEDICRSNKMIKVIRGSSIREMLQNSMNLSKIIRKTIVEDQHLVWIAQRGGRTKDGNDATDQGVIKMFAMSGGEDLFSNILELNIIPVAISYQIEPCDWMKAKEILLSKNDVYVKAPNEDFQSIITGIMQRKGNICLKMMKPLNHKLIEKKDEFSELCGNDRFRFLANLIDNEIHLGYHVFDTNYIAYDILTKSLKYADKYTQEAKKNFVVDVNEKIAKIGHSNYEELREIFLTMYANPVINRDKARNQN
ncbi:glycerol acyltransferase [Bacteroidia bacterium]|nr:glycerol acyltransferase [Bacteroidia bacterium]